MKRNKKKGRMKTAVGATLGLSTLAIVASIPLKSHADIDWGGGNNNNSSYKTIEEKVPKGKDPKWFYFNPNYNNGQGTPQSRFYAQYPTPGEKQRLMWREVYPGGFVWYSIIPPEQKRTSLQETDLSFMLENRQKVINGGDYIVPGIGNKPYAENLKLGAIDPYSHSYRGHETADVEILYGDFKGHRYEWRFRGYDLTGTVIENPYFPADVGQAKYNGNTREGTKKMRADNNWIEYSWNLERSKELFGISVHNENPNKKKWIEDYFLKEYPEFREYGNADHWAKRLMPMTDPSKVTGVWVGWHEISDGRRFYQTFVTQAPKQPNLRIVEYAIYDDVGSKPGQWDSGDKLVAVSKRGNDYDKWEETVQIKEEFVHKGKTYVI